MSNTFQELMKDYDDQLNSFTQALNSTIETFARDVTSLNEAQNKIETHLSRSLKEWVTAFGGSYAIHLKQMARQYLLARAGDDHSNLFELEEGLDQAVEQRLIKLSQPDGHVPALDVPSPYVKPGATFGATTLISFLLLVRGSFLFLAAGVAVGGGGLFASRKILQNELLRTRKGLSLQAKSVVDEFKQDVENYFQISAQAIEETTILYIQKHLDVQ